MSSQGSIPHPSSRHHEAQPSEEKTGSTGTRNTGRKKRVRHWTPDDRATHRVFERSRREAFKNRLASLASRIPSLQSTDASRLTKHVVLDESIALHTLQQNRLESAMRQVESLIGERDELLAELNSWRTGAGMDMREAKPLEDLPEPNASPSKEHGSGVDGHSTHDPDDYGPGPSAPMALESDHDGTTPFEPLPTDMGVLDAPPLVGHTGVVPPEWNVMDMGMNLQGMTGNEVAFNKNFAPTMVSYLPGVTAASDVDPSYIPHLAAFQQLPMNIANAQYGGGAPVYGQRNGWK